MDKDVDTSSETETFLEEIPGGKLIDIGLGRNFLDIIHIENRHFVCSLFYSLNLFNKHYEFKENDFDGSY